ncbi:MAG: tetratricopeptide repeat protein [Candidatus Obscuribacterales bacterium]|nr:tetratricopeptide repeat protein [Candidatus Obscuribacterales bacterium]
MSRKWQKHLEDARLYSAKGQFEEAERVLLEAMRICEKTGKKDLRLAETLHEMGVVLVHTGSFEEAEEALLRALALREQELGKVHRDVAATLTALGKVLAPFESEAAEKRFRQAISIYHELDESDVVFPVEQLSTLLMLKGRGSERGTMLEALVYRMRSLKKKADAGLKGKSLSMLAAYYEESDEHRAEQLLLESIPLFARADSMTQILAESNLLLGKIQYRQSRFEASQANFSAAFECASAALPGARFVAIEASIRLAKVSMVLDCRYDDAEKYLDRAVEICRQHASGQLPQNLILEYESLVEFSGNYNDLLTLRKELLRSHQFSVEDARDKCEMTELSKYATAESCNIARLLLRMGQASEAESYARWAVSMDDQCRSPKIVNSLIALADTLAAQGQRDEASAVCDRIFLAKTDNNWYFPQLIELLRVVALLNRNEDAERLEVVAQRLIQQYSGDNDWVGGLCQRLALVLSALSRPSEASALMERALRAVDAGEQGGLFLAFKLECWSRQFINVGDDALGKELAARAKQLRDSRRVKTTVS